jgi:hypothetical protein
MATGRREGNEEGIRNKLRERTCERRQKEDK